MAARTLLDLSSPGGDPKPRAQWRIRETLVLLSGDGVLNVLDPPAAEAWTLHRSGLQDHEVAAAVRDSAGLDLTTAATSCRRLLDHLHRSGCCLDRDACLTS
jgi:hypothetical protein